MEEEKKTKQQRLCYFQGQNLADELFCSLIFFCARSVSPDQVTKPTTTGSKNCSSGTIKLPFEGTAISNGNLVFPVCS